MRVGKEKGKLMRTDGLVTGTKKSTRGGEGWCGQEEGAEVSTGSVKCEVPVGTSENMFSRRVKHLSLAGRNFG